VVYSRYALEDIRQAVEWCRRHAGSDVRPVGLCSGAFFALKSAATIPDIAGFVAINPLTFDKPPPGPTDYPRVRTAREAARYRRSLGNIEKWKKLLRGEVRIDAVVKTVGAHLRDRARRHVRELARRFDFSMDNDVGAELLRLAERNVEQCFVFASTDPGMALLRDEADSVVRKLVDSGKLRIDILEGTDHTFTACWSHGPLVSVLTNAIAPTKR
jgi:hypothetical protein